MFTSSYSPAQTCDDVMSINESDMRLTEMTETHGTVCSKNLELQFSGCLWFFHCPVLQLLLSLWVTAVALTSVDVASCKTDTRHITQSFIQRHKRGREGGLLPWVRLSFVQYLFCFRLVNRIFLSIWQKLQQIFYEYVCVALQAHMMKSFSYQLFHHFVDGCAISKNLF